MRSVLFVVAVVAAAAAGPVLLSLLLRVGTPMKNPNLSAGDDTMKMGIVDDYLCAICDDGGSLVCCDGECGRLFHPNSVHGQASNCRSLELQDDQWKPESLKFICKNCEYKSHQCFVCGKLGSSERTSGSSEVLKCQKKYCRRFYHPNCLLKYDPSKNHQDFECPLHECHSCKNKGGTIITKEHTEKEEETYLVQCRRCLVAYHRKCLPRDISNVADDEVPRTFKFKIKEGSQEQEQWFFYCREHEMVRELNSAIQDHLKFPEPSIPSLEHMVGELNNATWEPSISSLEHEKVGELNSATQDHLPEPSIPSLDDDMVGDLNSETKDHLPEPSIPSLDDDMVGDLNSATEDHLPEPSITSLDDDMVGDLNSATQDHLPEPSIPSLEHDMVGEPNNATQDHLNFPEKPVFNFDLNEKPPEETEAPEPNASTSSAPMESSASRPSFP